MKIYQAKGRECLFYILRKWPKILVGAIVVALALGALKGINTARSWDSKQADVDTIMDQRDNLVEIYEESLASIDADIESKENETAAYRECLDGADILRADENAVGIASVDLYFASYNEDGTVQEFPDGTVDLFSSALTNSIDWNQIADNAGLSPYFLDQMLIVSINGDNNMLSLKMFGLNAEQADGMLNDVLSQASILKAGYVSQIPGFDYMEMNRTSYTGRSIEYIDIRGRIQSKYNELLVATNDLYASKDELEAPPAAVYMPTKAQVALSIVKHTVLGWAIGVVVVAVLFYVLFYLNGKLHSADELAYYSDSNTMVYLSTAGKKRSKLYRFIAKMENKGLLYSQKEAVLRTLSNIRTKYPEATKVMFTGVNAESEAESLKKALESAKGMGFIFGIEKNILIDKEAFDHLGYYDVVVLVEKVDSTSVDLINKEIEQIDLAGKKIAGSLIVR